ncbi:MAG: CHAT domain-containing protein [Myxococcales bacterium]|nr:CHAT domain-containing protein [Myxococcales bacterium]
MGLCVVSACETAEAGDDEAVDSLAQALLGEGFRAVMGWAGTVSDGEATAFTTALYTWLARGGSLVRRQP